MSKRAAIAIAGILLLILLIPQPAAAQSNDANTLIALVNQLRAEYGLPPYQVNPRLMSAAQSHTDWAASVGSHSHTGAGGTTPEDRVVAAGYGPRDSIWVGENIYWGTDATPEIAFDWWRNSTIHFQNMTSTDYDEIGAGAASNGNVWFYTLNFGRVRNSSESSSEGEVSQPVGEDTGGSSGGQAETGTVINEDGSVAYIVQSGDSLYGIADDFNLTIIELQQMNGLAPDQGIHPGDRLIVSPSAAAAGEDSGAAVATPRPPLYHTVAEGDTALGIALQYGIDLGDLYTLNQMNDATVLMVGDQLLIRAGDPTPTPTIPPTPVPTIQVATATPAATSTPIISFSPTLAETPVQTNEADTTEKQGISPLLIGGLFGAVIIGAAIGTFTFLVRQQAVRR
jgi:LysM repeat protein